MKNKPTQATLEYNPVVKALVGVPGWADGMFAENNKIGSGGDAYSRVPLIYRAVNIRCNSLIAVPFHLYKGEQEVEWDKTFNTPLKQLLWWTEAAMLFRGQAFWLKQDAESRRLGAQWLNPYTMTVKAEQAKNETGGVQLRLVFTQKVNSINLGPWTEDQIVFFKEFNPSNDATGGLSPVMVAMEDARLMHYMSRFTSIFFENGAMPVTILAFEGNPKQDEVDRVAGRFSRMAEGIKNAFGVVGIKGGVKPSTLTPRIDSLAMPENRRGAVQDIAWAFGIPETMLTDAANYATATAQHQSFYSETINPRADYLAEMITQKFLKQVSMRLEADPEEMSIFQVDEAQRAGSLAQLTQAGIPLELAMDLLGYELDEDQEAILQKYLEERAKNTPPSVPPQSSIGEGSNTQPQPTVGEGSQELSGDIGKWYRKSIKALEKGKSADVEFETEEIGEEAQAEIHLKLAACQKVEDVKAVFAPLQVTPPQPSPLRGEGGRELIEELKEIRMALMDEERDEVKHTYENGQGGAIKIQQGDINIPAPMVTVNIPKDAIRVDVNVPPSIVNVPAQAAPVVNVNVPEQKAPVVNVPAPVVNVNMPEEPKRKKVVFQRDPKGNITGAEARSG